MLINVITFSESRLMTESISALSQTFITQHGLDVPRLALCPVLNVRDRHIIHGFCHQLLPTFPHSPIYFSLSSQRIFTKRYSVLSLHYLKFSMAFLLIYNKIQVSSRLPMPCPSSLSYFCHSQCFVLWPSQCSSNVQLYLFPRAQPRILFTLTSHLISTSSFSSNVTSREEFTKVPH